MKISLIYFTRAGEETCLRIEQALAGDGHVCLAADGKKLSGGLDRWTREAFAFGEALVFVSAAGIAVRAVAPYLRSKTQDPAVVVVDERGLHAVSLLSGHMGGANDLTRRIAEAIGAEPVITTATDINGKFAVDQWAKKQGLAIADMKAAKEVSAALLRGETVGFYSELPLRGELPEGLVRAHGIAACTDGGRDLPERPLGIAVALRRPEGLPFRRLLWLAPRVVALGVGCRRGIGEEQIRRAVEDAFGRNGLAVGSIREIVSIDLKKDEPGLISFAKSLGVPFRVFSAGELSQAELPEGFEASDFVKGVTGVDNVCERAAVLAAGRGSVLLLRKQAGGGVTAAAAARADGIELSMDEESKS